MKKKLIILALSSIILSLLSMTTFAYVFHKSDYITHETPLLNCGIDDNMYYISPGTSTQPYASNISTGVKSWNMSTSQNAISFTETTSYWSSVCDVSVISSNSITYAEYAGKNGFIRIWVGEGIGGNNNDYSELSSDIPGNYFAGEVFINSVRVSSTNSNHVKQVTAHEVGHLLGYNHPTYDSIMTQPIPSTLIAPTTEDKQLIIDLYSWWGY